MFPKAIIQTGRIRPIVELSAFMLLAVIVSTSAWWLKRHSAYPAFAAVDTAQETRIAALKEIFASPEADGPELIDAPAAKADGLIRPEPGFVRYFNGRPIRPAKTMWMTVTGYSPDARSCEGTDDGYTATNHSVFTNAMQLVAADTRVLPFGSMISVPGYADGEVVPVLDRGGAIKGRRLDLLFATHEVARKWGRQRVQITVWEYADGLPPPKATTRYPVR
ncbi:MAG TPA: 3D domain-containing protein [Phycisphaerales bacterium]|nr:3D domain-containing protein [Phycisphaerales bacterium]